jgi:hypothetical protein
MPARRRKGFVISAKAPANSHSPVMKITCGAKGTQSGVILRNSPGTARCATPPATKNAARIQRMTARAVGKETPAFVQDFMRSCGWLAQRAQSDTAGPMVGFGNNAPC